MDNTQVTHKNSLDKNPQTKCTMPQWNAKWKPMLSTSGCFEAMELKNKCKFLKIYKIKNSFNCHTFC